MLNLDQHQGKIKYALLILAAILIALVLGLAYQAKREIPKTTPENMEVNLSPAELAPPETEQEILESLSAPTADNPTPSAEDQKLLESLSAPTPTKKSPAGQSATDMQFLQSLSVKQETKQ